MKRSNFMKHVIAIATALVFTMLMPVMGDVKTSVNEVQAAETVTTGYVIVPKGNVTITKTANQSDVMTVNKDYEEGKYVDYLFAGWYQDATATKVATSTSNRAYARFVPSDVLSTKCQVTNGVVTDTSIDKYKDKYVLRFVSSIDSLNYNNVGFEISYKDGDETVTRTNTTKTVFERIESTTGTVDGKQDTYKFSPKVVDTKSEYFITAKWPVDPTDAAMNNDITVRAFWTTKDGIKVYGPSRCVCVNDGLSATQTINMSFENTAGSSVNVGDVLNVSEDANASATVISVNGTTVHVRISGIEKDSMKSATMFTFTADGSTVGKEIYRNLYTQYAGIADETWHTTYQSADNTEKEFTIATNADLYGFATLANAGQLAEDVKVYLVADIEIQSGDASTWASGAPELTWTPIGTATQNTSTYKDELINPFNGTFDGQGHTISGVYVNAAGTMYQGLFGATGTSAVLQNFRLENSYIRGSHASGAIAGAGNGTFKNIYSEAIVDGTGAGIGGMIGRNYNSGIVMENCWNAGPVSTTRTGANTNTGGLVGLVGVASSFTDCMNTGSVSATNSNNTEIALGGLVGCAQANVTITDCLNTGSISQHAAATSGYGSILGNVESGTTNIYTSYAAASNCTDAVGTTGATLYNNSGAVIEESAVLVQNSLMTGIDAVYELAGFDCINRWAYLFDATPIPKVFEDKAGDNLIDTNWYDASETEFTLYDKADLYGFLAISTTTGFKDKTVKLGADIEVNTGDAKDWATTPPVLTWRPIGEITATTGWHYQGTFDGQGHAISGIYLNTSRRYAGLFAAVNPTGVVQNLKLENSYFESSNWDLGSIAGLGQGKFYNIYSDAIVKGNALGIGGLIGLTYACADAAIENCWFDGTVTNTGNGNGLRGTGGFVGRLDASNTAKFTLRNCLNTGTVDVTSYNYDQDTSATGTTIVPCAGGFIGQIITGTTLAYEIDSCLNLGEIKVHADATGGYGSIIGTSSGGTAKIYTTYAEENSCTKAIGLGRESVALYDSSNNLVESINVEATIRIPKTNFMGTKAANVLQGFDFTDHWLVVRGCTPVLKIFGAKGELYLLDTRWYDENQQEYTLYDMGDLYGFASLVNAGNDFAGKTVKLANDIEIQSGDASTWASSTPELTWTPIGTATQNTSTYKDDLTNPFNGTFDGQGHTISGVYIKQGGTMYQGLFGATGTSAVLQNFRLQNSYIRGSHASGAIAGAGNGTFKNIYSEAIVDGYGAGIGGFIGRNYNAGIVMENCWNAGPVSTTRTGANTNTGGLVGLVGVASSFTNCVNTGSVSATNSNNATIALGGFVGCAQANITITDCLNTGSISQHATATSGYGSILGKVESGTTKIYTSYADASNCAEAVGTTGATLYNSSNAEIAESAVLIETSKITGIEAIHELVGFDCINNWLFSFDEAPVLKAFEDMAGNNLIDTSWYNASGTEFTLYDKADLYGFLAISKTTGFKDKTVKLGADIEVNTGDAKNWATTAPALTWRPIGEITASSAWHYQGTFDGQGHTLSGIYLKTSRRYAGLFAAVTSTGVVQNVRLENSYFESSNWDFGSIAGLGQGKFYNIYSNAIVKGDAMGIGGLIGLTNASAEVVLENCWFDGTVTNTANGNGQRGTGGFVGRLDASNTTKFTLRNCLNTGTVDASAYNYDQDTSETGTTIVPCAGGFVGQIITGTTLAYEIDSCFNTGEIKVHANATGGYGSIIGTSSGGTATIYTSYADDNSCVAAIGLGRESVSLYNSSNSLVASASIEATILIPNASTIGVDAACELAGFDFINKWTLVFGEVPVPKVFEDKAGNNLIDTTWYDASKTEFTLYDKADLYGFLAISTTTGFKDKTVKLGADIEVNTGDAKNWATTAPALTWRPIGEVTASSAWHYQGTFDGQGHTLSGIYLKTSRRYAGLFAAVTSTGVVQNVRLENSYFESSNWDFGSIAGLGQGKFYNIYSNAIVKGNALGIGGLIGLTNASAEVVLENCWFDGTVTNTANGNGQRGTGGFVGRLDASNTTKFTLRNCLNTGTVDASAYAYNQGSDTSKMILTCAGGFIGQILNSGSLDCEIDSCLNTGEIKVHADATGGYGPIVGYNTPRDAVTIYKTYVTVESSNNNINRNGLNVVDASTIKGNNAKTNMPLLGWGIDWQCVTGDFPEIIFSTTGVGENADVTAGTADLTLLQTLYANRTLYQGDIHAHAKTFGKGAGVGDDGSTSLTTWSTQMNTLGLDFAASLDHHQTNHYNNSSVGWDLSKFVYGTEAGTTITDISDTNNEGTLHYNMIFPNRQKLVNVLTAFSSKFNYKSSSDYFKYGDFTKAEFANLIKKVISEGGFFVHAHPTQTAYSANVSDYYFTDYAGFEVFYLNTPTMDDMTASEKASYSKYGAYGSAESEAHYKVWDSLLKDGKRLYACSGSDTHSDLNTYALTSVYSTSAATTDKGTIITQLAAGDFTAGAVGIQMSIDNTKMGGHFAFADTSRLVVNVGDFFFDSNNVVNSTHKYRVDVITEDGVVYSRRLTMNGAVPTNGTIALDVDSTSKYYRVEIVDATVGHRIAIGNPIWNDK